MKNTSSCMDDCIHLKACRRLQKVARAENKTIVARHCDEQCTAYETEDEFIENCDERYFTYSEVKTCIRGAVKDAQSGNTDLLPEDYV